MAAIVSPLERTLVKVRSVALAASAAALLLLAACGDSEVAPGGGTTSSATPPPATSTATPPEKPGAEITKCLDAKEQPAAKPPVTFTKAEKVLTGKPTSIVMKTSCGTITIALDEKAGGPIPNSIAFLASKGFYDGLTFHRVVPDFVLQGGDPQGDGTGGAGYQVEGAVPEGYKYKLGDVAMAKTASDPPGTSGSQFFVVSGPQGEEILTSQPVYGILGHAADAQSLATIKRIADLAVADGPPSQPVWIITATLDPAS